MLIQVKELVVRSVSFITPSYTHFFSWNILFLKKLFLKIQSIKQQIHLEPSNLIDSLKHSCNCSLIKINYPLLRLQITYCVCIRQCIGVPINSVAQEPPTQVQLNQTQNLLILIIFFDSNSISLLDITQHTINPDTEK